MIRPADQLSDSRFRWKLVFAALVAATIVLWVLLCYRIEVGLGPNLAAYAYFATLNFHSALLGFWVGLGHARWRFVFVAIIGVTLAAISNQLFGANGFWEFQMYTLGNICVVAGTTWALRLGYGTLRQLAGEDTRQGNALRFGIKQIMIWTAVIAVLHVVARLVFDFAQRWGIGGLRTDTLVMIGGLAFCVSIATVVNVWALLQIHVSIVRITILVIIVVGASMGIYLWWDGGLLFAATTMIAQLFMGIAMWLLRMQGLRFMKVTVTAN